MDWSSKVIHYWNKWPVGIWAPPLWSMWMSCKLGAGFSNSYSFTGPNVYSTLIYLGKHWELELKYKQWCTEDKCDLLYVYYIGSNKSIITSILFWPFGFLVPINYQIIQISNLLTKCHAHLIRYKPFVSLHFYHISSSLYVFISRAWLSYWLI